MTRRGWLDGADTSQEHRVVLQSFTPFMEPSTNNYPIGYPMDTGLIQPLTPRVETELIGGIPVSKTIRTVAIDTMQRLVVEELRMTNPAETNLLAAWRDPSTPHTIRRHMPESIGKPCSSLPELIVEADGTATHYEYISGYCTNGVDGLPGDFESASGAPHFRTVITRGTRDSFGLTPDGLATNGFEGIPGRTTREVKIETRNTKRELQRETYVCSAPGEYERISWTTTTRDSLEREIATRSSDGTRTEKSWNAAGRLAWEIGADGVRTDYTYDMLGRTVRTVRKGAGSQPDITTATIYDAADRVLSTIVSAGGLSQTTTNRYDGVGRLAWTRSPDGIETAYSYGFTEAGLPFTSTIRGFGAAFASTNTIVRHKDGQTAWTEFNGVRKTTYAYGVNPDGTRWTLSVQGDLPEAIASQLTTGH